MCQSCFLVCLLLAIGGFVIVGCGQPPGEPFILDKILRVGDGLPCFSLNDIRDSDYGVKWTYGNTVVPGRTIPLIYSLRRE